MKTKNPPAPHLHRNRLLQALCLTALTLLAATPTVNAQLYTGTNSTTAWNTSRWSSSTNGPFTSAWVNGSQAVFLTGGIYEFAGGTAALGNITVQSNATVTFTNASGSLNTSSNAATFDVAAGALLDFGSQGTGTGLSTGIIKSGEGVFATTGNTYTNGFTLNAGTIVLRGINAMGNGAGQVVTLNGGTVAANSGRTITARYGGGFNIAGNVQFGAFSTNVSLSSDTAFISFGDNVNLGGANRTLTLGSRGAMTFGGIISNGSLTFASVDGAQASVASAGRFQITNAANTFTGDININGPDVRFLSDGSLGNAANNIIIDGGRLGMVSDTTNEIAATRNIFIGDAAGTSISAVGAAGLLTYNGVIQNKTGETGSWIKQGGGTLVLGGASTYTGTTRIAQGVLLLTNGNNRLPTGTVLSIGQAGAANLGTLNLNGYNQEIAGLSSTGGNNATANNNTVTSATAATLTINVTNGQSYSFGNGSDTNSGVITGSIALTKKGAGTQVLGDDNDYTGATTVEGGTLALESTSGNQAARSTTSMEVQTGATLLVSTSEQVNDTAAVTLSGGTIQRGSGVSETFGDLTLNTAGTLDYVGGTAGTLEFGAWAPGSTVLTLNNFFKDNVLKFSSDLSSFISTTAGSSFSNSNFSISGMAAGGFTADWDGSTFTITSVPEPSTVLAALGLTGLMLWPTARRVHSRLRARD